MAKDKNKSLNDDNSPAYVFAIFATIVIVVIIIIFCLKGCSSKSDPSSISVPTTQTTVEPSTSSIDPTSESTSVVPPTSESSSTSVTPSTSESTATTVPTSSSSSSSTAPVPINKYVVKFYNNDGSLLKEYKDVEEGSSVVYDGPAPIYVGTTAQVSFYEFEKWDKETVAIASNLDVYAQYKAIVNKAYHRYVNWNDSFLYDVTLNAGEAPTYGGVIPEKPNSDGQQFNFKDWNKTDHGDGRFTYKALFENCTEGLVIVDGVITDFGGDGTDVTIPESWNGQTITSIDESAFEGNTTIESITIPDTVTIIEENAFSGCTNLTDVNLSNDTTTLIIEDSAFSGCTNLTTITIPDNTVIIGDYAFEGSGLTSITLPDSIDCVEEGTFENCEDLTSVTLPDTCNVIKMYAFEGCKSLTTFDFTHVTVIESYAFRTTSLYKVVLPATISYIGEEAFSGYDDLLLLTPVEEKNPDWDDSWAGGANVCYGFTGFNTFTVGTITYDCVIEYRGEVDLLAIIGMTGFDPTSTVLEIPSNIDIYEVTEYYITSGTFDEWNNYNLKEEFQNISSIILSSNIMTIGARAFQGMRVESITFPTTGMLRYINAYAFAGNNLGTILPINLPNSVKRIETNAFSTCYGYLIFVSSYVDYIGISAFANIRGLYIQNSYPNPEWNTYFNEGMEERTVYSAGKLTHQDTRKFWYSTCTDGEIVLVTVDDQTITSFTSNTSTLYNVKINAIGPSAFRNFKKLRNVDISKACFGSTVITKVYEDAFAYTGTASEYGSNPGLLTLLFNENIEHVGKGVIGSSNLEYTLKNGVSYFKGVNASDSTISNNYAIAVKAADVSSQNYYTLESSCRVLGSSAFSGGTNVLDVILPSSLVSIESGAMRQTMISSFEIPDSVKYIGGGAFEYCTSLVTADLPSSLEYLGRAAFMNTKIQSVVIPDGVEFLEQETYEFCSSLTSVTFGANMASVGSRVFYDCVALSSVSLNNGCQAIGDASFINCTSLKSIDLKDVSLIKDAAFSNSGLESFNITDNVLEIESSAIAGCQNLSSVTIGTGLKVLKHGLFARDSALKTITLPYTLKAIEYECFLNSGLTSIYIPDSIVFMGTRAFDGCGSLSVINVEHDEKPNTWAKNWLGNCEATVVWGI